MAFKSLFTFFTHEPHESHESLFRALLMSNSLPFMRLGDEHGEYYILQLDSSIYSKKTILKTAYWYTDKLYILLQKDDKDKNLINVLFRLKNTSSSDITKIIEEFQNTLIDFSVRELIEDETSDIHTAIVKRAFSEVLSKKDINIMQEYGI